MEDELGNEDVIYDNAFGDEATTEIGGELIGIHKAN